ncbi:MAG: hypothetical protein R2771_10785 [Saprospiraceae bacterium]
MKFESLKSKKFEDFRTNLIQDSFKIVGGADRITPSTYKSSDGTSGTDTCDWNTKDVPVGDDKGFDYSRD